MPLSQGHSRRGVPGLVLWAAGLVILAGFLRFYALELAPGFDFDEGDAASLARAIGEGRAFPLIGEKIYRGPAGEYFGALTMAVTGRGIFGARFPGALLGSLTCLLVLALGTKLFGERAGLLSAFLLATSAWHVMLSRVYHVSNFNVFLLTAAALCLVVAVEDNRPRWLLGCAIFLGLAVHGHAFALLILAPALCYAIVRRGWRWVVNLPSLCRLAGGVLVPTLPMIWFNIGRGFPTLRWFLAGSEGHLVGSAQPSPGLLARWLGYLWSVRTTLAGSCPWFDLHVAGLGKGVWPLFWLFVAGACVAVLRGGKRPTVWLPLVWGLLVIVVVPLITKHREWMVDHRLIYPSLPTYLSVLFPVPVLLIGLVYQELSDVAGRRKLGWGVDCLAILLVCWSTYQVVGPLRNVLLTNGGTRRLEQGIGDVSIWLNRQARAGDVVLTDYVFEGGYYQLRYLLEGPDVRPLLPGNVPARVEVAERPGQPVSVYFVRYVPRIGPPPPGSPLAQLHEERGGSSLWEAKALPPPPAGLAPVYRTYRADGSVNWEVFHYFSPLIALDFEFAAEPVGTARRPVPVRLVLTTWQEPDRRWVNWGENTLYLSDGRSYPLTILERREQVEKMALPQRETLFQVPTGVDPYALKADFTSSLEVEGTIAAADSDFSARNWKLTFDTKSGEAELTLDQRRRAGGPLVKQQWVLM